MFASPDENAIYQVSSRFKITSRLQSSEASATFPLSIFSLDCALTGNPPILLFTNSFADTHGENSCTLEAPPLVLQPFEAIPVPKITNPDSFYLEQFVNQISSILPYLDVFPAATRFLINAIKTHSGLKDSVLSLSALSNVHSRFENHRAFEYFAKAIEYVQSSISSPRDAGEDLAMTIFFLALFSVRCGEYQNARKHLNGLQLIFNQIKGRLSDCNSGVVSLSEISPLLWLIWRIAIRIDYTIAVLFGSLPVLPVYNHLLCYFNG